MIVNILQTQPEIFLRLNNGIFFQSSLSNSVAVTLIHAFINSRLDYSNRVQFEVHSKTLDKLQHVENSATRVLTRTKS